MTFFERIAVQHAHPTKFVLELLGVLWSLYFVWQHDWIYALLAGIGLPLLGTILVWGKNEEGLARSLMGKIMLLHLEPLNMLMHTLGYLIVLYGLWFHSGPYILFGISFLFLGHLWGWKRVSENI